HCPQVPFALVFGLHAMGKELAQLRACLARNLLCLGNPDQILHRSGLAAAHETSSGGIGSMTGAVPCITAARGKRRLPASLMVRIWCLEMNRLGRPSRVSRSMASSKYSIQ